jgi:positive regulator of sigma E activity
LRREVAYFVILVLAALALFGTHDFGLVAVIPIFVVAALAGWLVTRHYRRGPQKDHTDTKGVA